MLEAGAELGPWRFDRVHLDAMRSMAVILDDPNPIHIDPEAVQALGMGERTVNQGPLNLAYVMNMLAEGAPQASLERLTLRFTGNVLCEDVVLAGGRVESVEDGLAEVAVWLDVEGGKRALDGIAALRF